MNKGIKNALIFISGAAVGAGATTLALRQFYNNYINESLTDEINKELDKIKSDYDARLEALKNQYKTESKPAKKESKAKKPTKTSDKKTKDKEDQTDYTKFSAGKKTTVKDVKAEAIKQIQEDKKSKTEDTEIISFEDYTSDNGYEKLTYTFWRQDRVYSDELDDPELDLPHIIGELIDKYDDYGDGSSLYIRSDSRETDYEIIVNDGSYYNYINSGEAL